MSYIFRTLIVFKDGSMTVEDERGVTVEDAERPFRREDVTRLRDALSWLRVGGYLEAPAIESLADRIEALLPPEK